jgi:hypothetical protein
VSYRTGFEHIGKYPITHLPQTYKSNNRLASGAADRPISLPTRVIALRDGPAKPTEFRYPRKQRCRLSPRKFANNLRATPSASSAA